MAFFHSTPQDCLWNYLQWACIYIKSLSTLFSTIHMPTLYSHSLASLKNHQVLPDDDKSWTQLKFLNCVLIMSISLYGCPSASHVALTWLVQILPCWGFAFLSQDFLIFYTSLWFTNFGESVFPIRLHELHHLQSPVEKGVGVFLFCEILPRLWRKRGGLKKPKSKSITQVYDKKKLGN